ncbi:MAG: ROK family protein [Anaerolineaceae bacterium]|nr:ROK family protein [Anaerolineaceae bacterium]
MNISEKSVIAMDIGGTKLAAALISPDGELRGRIEVPTCQTGKEQGFQQICDVFESVLSESGVFPSDVSGIGIGIPAVLEKGSRQIIWAPNINGWKNFDLRKQLEEELNLPVYMEYDGHTAVLGEWWLGAGKDCESVVMVVIGTGIGGGTILEGKLIRGINGLAGAVGWFAMTSNSQLMETDNRNLGHWESLAAGPGIAKRAAQLLDQNPESLLNKFEKEKITARIVFDLARKDDIFCLKIVNETAGFLGLGISNIVDMINPEKIILGGSVGRQLDLMKPEIQRVMNKWAQPISSKTVKLEQALLGADVGLYGAAFAAFNRSKF